MVRDQTLLRWIQVIVKTLPLTNLYQVLDDGTLVLRRLDSRGAGRYACRVETGVTKRIHEGILLLLM